MMFDKVNENHASILKSIVNTFIFDVTVSFIALTDLSHSEEEITIVLTAV